MLRMLDLFAGIGGASVAGDRLGILTTQFVEINSDAQLILRQQFPQVSIHDDIRTYHPSPRAFDLIWNSFPYNNKIIILFNIEKTTTTVLFVW